MIKSNARSESDRRQEMLTAWAEREATIVRKNANEYDLEWGRLREEFYDQVGSVPLPPVDVDRLASMKDKHRGERIFIIGNGPSINRTPLDLLKDEYTFGVNRIYLLYDRIDWKPTFYTALDWRVVPDTAREINALTGSTFFFEERFRGLLREGDDTYYYTHSPASREHPEDRHFSHDASRGLRGAGSVIGTAVQIAFHMGFDPIYLIGCDLGYKVPETVKQEGEDRFGNGVKLHLTSTEDDDANHFDPRYFGKGRRWHDPNVKRMVEGHEQCKRGIESVGRRIFNATMGGELDVYPRKHFMTLFPDRLMEPKKRDDRAHVDETAVVAQLLKDRTGPDHVMVDVGAHQGTSAVYFDKQGWSIHCFEPDRNNRERLLKRFGDRKNLFIDPRAVSDEPAQGVSFFTSNESSGISGLHAFRDTHRESDKVDITTIEEIVSSRGLSKVDFLKIDVEGFDLNVLKGVPWGSLKPDVVECEFEDAKTEKMGHTWREVAEFLRVRGYAVYLSQWHPIVRYGVPHDWMRVVPYPGIEMPSNSWGNILAFREDPGYSAVVDAFSALTTHRIAANSPLDVQNPNSSAGSPSAQSKTAPTKNTETQQTIMPDTEPHDSVRNSASPERAHTNGLAKHSHSEDPPPLRLGNQKSQYSKEPARLLQRTLPIDEPVSTSPGLPGLRKFFNIALTHISLRRRWVVPLVILLIFASAAISLPAFSGYRAFMLFGVFATILSGALLYVAFRSQSHAQALHQRAKAFEETCHVLRQQIALLERKSDENSGLNFLPKKVNGLASTISNLSGQIQGLDRKLQPLPAMKTDLEESKSQISQLRSLTDSVGANATRAMDKIGQSEQALESVTRELTRLKTASQSSDERFAESQKLIRGLESEFEKLQSLNEDIVAEIRATSEVVDQNLIAMREDLQNVQRRFGEHVAEYSDLPKLIQSTQQNTEASIDRADSIDRWMMFNNAEWYQTFNRRLSAEHVSTMERNWRKRLSVPMNKFSLSYSAAALCEIENRLHGRLATSVEDFLLRLAVAKAVKGERIHIMEIGVLFGIDIAAMYDALSINFDHVQFTLLDPLDGYYRAGQSDGLTGVPITEQVLRDNLHRVGMPEESFRLIKHLSTDLEAIDSAAESKYDVLVIDGDHSYAGVKADFENYAHNVKLGGYIIFDDYGSDDWPDVQAYVDKEIEQHSFVSKVGHSWRTCVYRVVKPAGAADR